MYSYIRGKTEGIARIMGKNHRLKNYPKQSFCIGIDTVCLSIAKRKPMEKMIRTAPHKFVRCKQKERPRVLQLKYVRDSV